MHTVTVTPDGRLRFIYDDSLAPLRDLGPTEIRRASHVEPTADGQWLADMAPVAGPVLGPFSLRGEALAAEREYLRSCLNL